MEAEREHPELAAAAPSANAEADPHGVDHALEYGPEHDDEYVALEEPPGAGRGMKPDLVVCPSSREGGEQWAATLRHPASVAGVDSERQAGERQRDRLFRDFVLAKLGGYLVQMQGTYLDSGDPVDLAPISQKDLAARIRETARSAGESRDGPGKWEIDKTRVSRALDGTWVELPSGEVVPLRVLAPNRRAQVLRFIAGVFGREDDLRDGVKGLVGRDEIRRRVFERYGVRENTLRRAVGEYHMTLPLDPDRRIEAYRKGEDWWTHRRS